VDYIFQLTPKEQRRVAASMGHARAAIQPREKRKQPARLASTAGISG